MLTKEEKTKRARAIGRMPYDQVRPLFDEAMKERQERRVRGCPDCIYISGPNWHHCSAYTAFHEANKQYLLQADTRMAVREALRSHKQTCAECYIEDYWREFESHCKACEEKSEIFWLYSKRLDHLRSKEYDRRFLAAHGRAPASKLELAEWLDAQKAHVEI